MRGRLTRDNLSAKQKTAESKTEELKNWTEEIKKKREEKGCLEAMPALFDEDDLRQFTASAVTEAVQWLGNVELLDAAKRTGKPKLFAVFWVFVLHR